MVLRELTFSCVLLIITSQCLLHVETRSLDGIRSDVIETKYVAAPGENKLYYPEEGDGPDLESRFGSSDPKKPGWMVRLYRKLFNSEPKSETETQMNTKETPEIAPKRSLLMRFGDITSRVSNNLGGTAMKVAGIIEKLCKMLKTVIPIVAAVCNVGQFKFCMSADAPLELGEAMNRPLDLNVPDK